MTSLRRYEFLLDQLLDKMGNYKDRKLQIEEFIIFLRQHFRDNNITFGRAKMIQQFIRSMRFVVDGDGDDDRLSKIEEIYFYGSPVPLSFMDNDPKKNDILDQALKNDTINCLIEDVYHYIPLIPFEVRLVTVKSIVIALNSV